MNTNLKKLLHFLNLVYFAEFAPEAPKLSTKKKKKRKRQDITKDKLKSIGGQLYRHTVDGNTVKFELDVDQRTDQINDRDKHIVATWHTSGPNRHKLNLAKYGHIKHHWSKGITVPMISRTLTKQFKSGYSISTIEKYKAAIETACNPSPTGVG